MLFQPKLLINKDRGMAQNEVLVVLLILFVISFFSFFNYRKAQILGRDIQRKNDLKHVATALDDYFKTNGAYPKAENGKIMACGTKVEPKPCRWGADHLGSSMQTIPVDPLASTKDYRYVYFSNTREFQLYAHLERDDDAEYNKSIAVRDMECGTVTCNFGVANGKTPLDHELPIPTEATSGGLPNEQ